MKRLMHTTSLNVDLTLQRPVSLLCHPDYASACRNPDSLKWRRAEGQAIYRNFRILRQGCKIHNAWQRLQMKRKMNPLTAYPECLIKRSITLFFSIDNVVSRHRKKTATDLQGRKNPGNRKRIGLRRNFHIKCY